MTVKVISGANVQEVEVNENTTIGTVREDLAEVLSIDPEAKAFVAGDNISSNYVLRDGDTIEFVKESGVKGL